MADSRTDNFSGDFSGDATTLAPYGPLDAFSDNFAAGKDYGQGLVHDPREHDHSQPLNDTQFPSQPQAPTGRPQKLRTGETHTSRHSGRYNAAVTAASGTALQRPMLNEYTGYS